MNINMYIDKGKSIDIEKWGNERAILVSIVYSVYIPGKLMKIENNLELIQDRI